MVKFANFRTRHACAGLQPIGDELNRCVVQAERISALMGFVEIRKDGGKRRGSKIYRKRHRMLLAEITHVTAGAHRKLVGRGAFIAAEIVLSFRSQVTK